MLMFITSLNLFNTLWIKGTMLIIDKLLSVFADENGKDQGVNVRQKVKELVEFVQDDDRLREERKKAKKNKDKYIGVSSDSMGYRSYRKFSVQSAVSCDN